MITKDDFINSDFHEALQALKNVIEEKKDIEISNKEGLRAFARLKKVVKYIATYISLVDYDLLATNEMQVLNNMSGNINKCRNYLSSSQINRANDYIDASLPMIKNIFSKYPLTRNNITSIHKEYSNLLQQNLDQIDFDTALRVSQQIQEIEQEQRIEKINAFYNKIYVGDDENEALEDIASRVNQQIQEIEQEQKIEKINAFYNKIYVGDDENEALEEHKNNLYNEITEIKNKIEESSNKQDDLNKYYTRIFGELDAETQERQGGLKQAIEMRQQALDKYKEEQKQAIEALKEKIESLMPNATSVGLAKAFSEEKKHFQGTLKKWNRGFIISIVVLLVFAALKIFLLKNDFSTLQGTLIFVLSGTPFFFPLVWLAHYCAKRRSEHAMLLQEYTHKETFANSYSSYKKQIEALQDKEELSNELLKKAITIIARNPTHVLNKKHSGDLPADEIKKMIEALTPSLPAKQKTEESE